MNLRIFSKVMLVLAGLYFLVALIQAGIFYFLVPIMYPGVAHEEVVADMAREPGVSAISLFLFKHIYVVLAFNLAFAVALVAICYGFERRRRWGWIAMLVLMWIQMASSVGAVIAFVTQPSWATGTVFTLVFSILVGAFSAWAIRWLKRSQVRAEFSA